MVDRIVNGNFNQSAGGSDADPVGWTVNEPQPLSVQAVNGILAFNRSGSLTGGSVTQTVADIPGGEPASFSFLYNPTGVGGTPAVTYSVIRIDPDGAETTVTGPTRVTGFQARTISHTFTAPAGQGPYSYRIVFNDTSVGDVGSSDSRIDNVVFDAPTCFTAGTLIRVAHGEIAVEALKVGDMVQTADHGLQPIRWIGKRLLSASELRANPKFLPIRIRAGALGAGLPQRDLAVSPQHRILLQGALVQKMFAKDGILIAARHLLGIEGVEILETEQVHYLHLLFDRHEIVFANGAETESLYLGEQSLKALSNEGRDEIYGLFPELENPEMSAPRGARLFARGREGRDYARLHADHQRQQPNA